MIESPAVVAQRSAFARIIVGELDGSVSERVRRFIDACTRGGIDARVSDAIDVELWQKFVFIVGVSGATAYFVGQTLPQESAPILLGLIGTLP